MNIASLGFLNQVTLEGNPTGGGITRDGSDEDGQNWDKGENLHDLGASGKDCRGLRECEVAGSAMKKRK